MKKFFRIATRPVRFSKASWRLILNHGAFACFVIGVVFGAFAAYFVMIAERAKAIDTVLCNASSFYAWACGSLSLICFGLCISFLAEKLDWKCFK
jgi:hypothetical protein